MSEALLAASLAWLAFKPGEIRSLDLRDPVPGSTTLPERHAAVWARLVGCEQNMTAWKACVAVATKKHWTTALAQIGPNSSPLLRAVVPLEWRSNVSALGADVGGTDGYDAHVHGGALFPRELLWRWIAGGGLGVPDLSSGAAPFGLAVEGAYDLGADGTGADVRADWMTDAIVSRWDLATSALVPHLASAWGARRASLSGVGDPASGGGVVRLGTAIRAVHELFDVHVDEWATRGFCRPWDGLELLVQGAAASADGYLAERQLVELALVGLMAEELGELGSRYLLHRAAVHAMTGLSPGVLGLEAFRRRRKVRHEMEVEIGRIVGRGGDRRRLATRAAQLLRAQGWTHVDVRWMTRKGEKLDREMIVGFRDVAKACGVTVHAVEAMTADWVPDVPLAALAAVRADDGLIGVDVCSTEAGRDLTAFAEAFRAVRNTGGVRCVHIGEDPHHPWIALAEIAWLLNEMGWGERDRLGHVYCLSGPVQRDVLGVSWPKWSWTLSQLHAAAVRFGVSMSPPISERAAREQWDIVDDTVFGVLPEAWLAATSDLQDALAGALRESGVVLETCPTSARFVRGLQTADLPSVRRPELRWVVGTDDPGDFGTEILTEWTALRAATSVDAHAGRVEAVAHVRAMSARAFEHD